MNSVHEVRKIDSKPPGRIIDNFKIGSLIKHQKQRSESHARTKWFLLYTLIKNNNLRFYRKHCIIKNESKAHIVTHAIDLGCI